MMIKQTKSQLIRYAVSNALIATFAVALGTTISGILHQDYLKIFNAEYAGIFFLCFVAAAVFSWAGAKKQLEITVDDNGILIAYEGGNKSFNWQEIANVRRPSWLLPRWLFELKQGDKIKIQTNLFERSQSRLLSNEILKYL